MNNFNLKQISSVLHYFELIKNDKFDEYTIKSLLIDIRDSIESETLKEICHFIAHPLERDRGITHSKIDRYYLQFKYANLTDAKAPTFPIQEMIKKEFDLIRNVISNSPDNFFNQETGMTKQEADNLLNNSYKSQDGKRKLHKKKALDKIGVILNASMRIIESKAVITQEEIIEELILELSKLCNEYISNELIIKILTSKSNDLMLCILSLLQSASFKLYDSKIAMGELIISKTEEQNWLYLNGIFPIAHFSNAHSISAPLISSKIDLMKYYDEPNIKKLTFEVTRNIENELKIKKLLPTAVWHNS